MTKSGCNRREHDDVIRITCKQTMLKQYLLKFSSYIDIEMFSLLSDDFDNYEYLLFTNPLSLGV